MCLNLKENYKKRIAKKDITVYKYLTKKVIHTIDSVKDGDFFNGLINNISVNGKIHKSKEGKIWFLTNNKHLDGSCSPEYFDYNYGWILDKSVSSVVVDGKELITEVKSIFYNYETPFRHCIINIGETYTSDIEIYENEQVTKALHSFRYKKDALKVISHKEVLVKCIIPKGSVYYFGKFDEFDSYASNKLTYVKIIK